MGLPATDVLFATALLSRSVRWLGFVAFARLYLEKLEPARLACLVDSAVAKNDLRLSCGLFAALTALALAVGRPCVVWRRANAVGWLTSDLALPVALLVHEQLL